MPVGKLFLFLLFLRAPDAVIRLLQPEDLCDRAGGADTTFLLEDAVFALSHNAEQEFLSGPHAFVVARAGPADAFLPVLINECLVFCFHLLTPRSTSRLSPAP